jgi:CarD family transcriptional regulator
MGDRRRGDEPDFAVGEAVVSARHGIGTVIERSLRRHEGVDREYVTIEIERRDMRLLVPIGGTSGAGLRRLSSRAEADRALAALAADPCPLPEDWRARQTEAVQRLAVGNLPSTAEVVRDFAHCARGRRLTVSDRELYGSARELLEAELAAVFGIGPREVATRVGDRLVATDSEPPG